jgi:hypothetical protein
MLRFGKDFFTLGKGISGSFHSAHGTSGTFGKGRVGSKGSHGGGQGQGTSENELHGRVEEDTISTKEESETVGRRSAAQVEVAIGKRRSCSKIPSKLTPITLPDGSC